jgi:hypothetical protein
MVNPGNRGAGVQQNGLPPFTLTCECGWTKDYPDWEKKPPTEHRFTKDCNDHWKECPGVPLSGVPYRPGDLGG